jgi:M6 family metalloprotease-like protein
VTRLALRLCLTSTALAVLPHVLGAQEAFQFERAWKEKVRRVRETRAAVGPRLGPAYSALQLNAAGAALSGTLHIPVLAGLASDQSAPYQQADYQRRLFGDGIGSVSLSEYYAEVSGGVLTVTGVTSDWVPLGNTAAYYELPPGGDAYGRTGEFIRDVLLGADPHLNFSQFDNDGLDDIPNSGDDDGFVDMVAFIYRSQSRSCDGSGILPHRGTYAEWWDAPFETNDPAANGGFIRVLDYTIQSGAKCGWRGADSIMGSGAIAHEIGHVFGLPDLYDTTPPAGPDSHGIGWWGLMGHGGEHTEISPAHFSAWSKDYLGWVNVTTVATNSSWQLDAVQTGRSVLRVDVPGTAEYFLLANRQAVGSDDNLPGPGLLIWHIDDAVEHNDDALHKLVDLEEADGRDDLDARRNQGDAGDAYPSGIGPDQNTRFDATSYPNSDSNLGAPSGVSITNIVISGGDAFFEITFPQPEISRSPATMKFTAVERDSGPVSQTLRITNAGGATLDWSVSDAAEWLSLSPTSGRSTGESDDVTVSVDPSGLAVGSYAATITIAAPAASNTPQMMEVTLTVTAPDPEIARSPATMTFTAVAGDGNPASQTLEIGNSGGGTLEWTVSDAAEWLSLSPASGSTAGETDSVSVSVNTSGLAVDTYAAAITVAAAAASNTPQTTFVTLELAQVIDTVTIVGEGPGDGTVTSSPARLACGITAGVESGNCAASFPRGTAVTLTVAGSSGWGDIVVRDLAGGSTACPGALCTPTYTLDRSRSFAVSFETQGPVIAVTPTALDFVAAEGGAAPVDQILGISNGGGGTLEWSVSDAAEWLSLFPASGSAAGETDSVTVSVEPSSLAEGTYTTAITVAAADASNTPQTTPITLTVRQPDPKITLNAESMMFTSVAGGNNPATQLLEIDNGGGGTLDWTVSGDAAWLNLSPPSGSSTGEAEAVTVGVNTAGLSAGTYVATVSIAAAGATNTPQTVAVTFGLLVPPEVEDVVAALLDGEALDEDRARYLDDMGNRNGRLDIGDFLAWLDRSDQAAFLEQKP